MGAGAAKGLILTAANNISLGGIPSNSWRPFHLHAFLLQRLLFSIERKSQFPRLGWRENPVKLFYMQNHVRRKPIPNFLKGLTNLKSTSAQPNKHLGVTYGSVLFLNPVLCQGWRLSMSPLPYWLELIPKRLFIPLAFPFPVFFECTCCLEPSDNNNPHRTNHNELVKHQPCWKDP